MNKVNLISTMPNRYEMCEAFKSLRTNILFSGSEMKVISITSTVENEGKSFVALELAKSLAETGRKVLLIDVDLRKSTLASRHVQKEGALFGLSHFLSGQSDWDSIIYGTQFPSFDVVFSGPFPPNPVELISSERFAEMLMHYREIYDYVIVDTPPLSSVIDSAVISNHCDGVIINIAENKVTSRSVRAVKAQLERGGCHILGAVLNFATTNKISYSHYYKSYYASEESTELPFASLDVPEKK